MSNNRWAWLGGLLAVGLPALLYLLTLDNNLALSELMGGDLITHQYAQAQFRLTNAPGYPVYTILGGLWFRASSLLGAWLNPIQRLSLYSTLYAIPALAVLYLLLLKTTRGNVIVAGLCTLFLSVTHFFWYYATTTEEYNFAVLQMGLLLYWAIRWDRLPTLVPPKGEERKASGWRDVFRTRDRYLVYMAFMVGLCLANLVTVLFAVPALLWFVLSREPGLWRRGWLIIICLAVAILPLFSYAYVYIIGDLHPEWRGASPDTWPNTLAWFLDFLSTGQGRSELTWNLSGGFPTWVFDALFDDFTVPALLAVVIGLFLLGRRRGLLMAGILAVYAVFIYIDRYGNWFQVFIPGHVVLMVGVAATADWLWRRPPGVLRWPVRTGVLVFCAALLLTRLAVNWPRNDSARRPGDDGLVTGWAILADDPAPGAAVVCTYEEGLSLDYLTGIWGARPDVQVLAATPDGATWTARPEPIYLTRPAAILTDPAVLAPFHLWSRGRLVEVRRQAVMDPPPGMIALPPGADIGAGQLSLLGYELRPRPEANALQVVFYWRASQPFTYDWTISARLMAAGQIVSVGDQPAQDDHPPVWGAYPTTRWRVGEIVRDDHLVPWQEGLEYDRVGAVVYRPTGDGLQNLGAVEFTPVFGGSFEYQ